MTKPKSRVVPSDRLEAITVLIVDDDQQMVRLLTGILSILGFRKIYYATDGTQALKVLRTTQIDLVFTEWVMEPMDGLKLVTTLRNTSIIHFRRLPIIMISGRSGLDDIRLARDAGVTEFLAKPFTVEKLVERLIALIDNPRSFVIANSYKGPDRRRKRLTSPAKERRKRKT